MKKIVVALFFGTLTTGWLFGQISMTGMSPTPTCPRDSFSVNFTASGVFNSGNAFIVQYSDDLAFTTPYSLNALSSSSSGSYSISGAIPGGAPAGTRYVRVVSTNPVMVAASPYSFTISAALPGVVGAISGDEFICPGTTVNGYAVGTTTNATTYDWTLPVNSSISAGAGTSNISVNYTGAYTSGEMFVVATNSCGSSNIPIYELEVLSPYVATYTTGTTVNFGGEITTPLVGGVAYAMDGTSSYEGCSAYTAGTFTGKIALIDRGSCSFSVKAKNAQDAGAIGVIIVNNTAGTLNMSELDWGQLIDIPVVFLDSADGDAIKAQLGLGLTVSMNPNVLHVETNNCLSITSATIFNTPTCPRDTFNVSFTTSGAFNPNNEFIIEVAEDAGFTIPVESNSIAATNSGNLEAYVPGNFVAGTKYVRVIATSPPYTFDVGTFTLSGQLPDLAQSYTGAERVCPGDVNEAYSITTVTNTTSYNWTVPMNSSIVTGSGTQNIGVDFDGSFTGGYIYANPANACGTSNVPIFEVEVKSPYTATYNAGSLFNFGGEIEQPLSGTLKYALDSSASYTGCVAYPPGTFVGNIALIDRGGCYFSVKIKNAQDAGAIGVLIADNTADPISNMSEGSWGQLIHIPAAKIQKINGDSIKSYLSSGVSIALNPLTTFVDTFSLPSVSGILNNNITCNNQNNAQITLTGSGGLPTYQYSLNGVTFTSSDVFTSLSAGSYTPYVRDLNGCMDTTSPIVVTNPAAVTTSGILNQDLSCHNSNDGSITVTAFGGTGILNYSVNGTDYSSSAVFNNLPANTYTLYARDGNNCVGSFSSITLTNPDSISAIINATQAGCSQNNGTASLTLSGGAGTLTENWGGENPNALSAGVYPVIITDASSCTKTVYVQITNPNAPTVSVNTTDVLCFGGNTGTASSTISGGTGITTRNWGSIDTTALSAGNYAVTVTDQAGCTGSASFTIDEPDTISALISTTQATCGSSDGTATLTLSGGTPSLIPDWAGKNPNALAAGTYPVVVTDANNCTNTFTVVITNPNAPDISVVTTDVLCYGDATGTAAETVIGGTGTVTLDWGGATPTFLAAGDYTVIATDQNNCTSFENFTIAQPAAALTASGTSVDANGGNNGSITVAASGGTGTITYSIDGTNFLGASTFSGLASGPYTITVKDANGCTFAFNITVGGGVGVEEVFTKSLKVYPNPVRNMLHVKSLGDSQIISVQLSNILGQVVWEKNGAPDDWNLDVSDLPAGVYTLQVYGLNGERGGQRIVVE